MDTKEGIVLCTIIFFVVMGFCEFITNKLNDN